MISRSIRSKLFPSRRRYNPADDDDIRIPEDLGVKGASKFNSDEGKVLQVTAAIQKQKPERITELLTTQVSYPSAEAKNFKGLKVYFTNDIVARAAHAVGIAAERFDTLKTYTDNGTIILGELRSGPERGKPIFHFGVPDQRPMIMVEYWEQNYKKDPVAPTQLKKFIDNLKELAAWITSNGFKSITIEPLNTKDKMAFPTAGDMLYYMARGLGGVSDQATTAITSPFKGFIHEITDKHVVIKSENLVDIFNGIVKNVAKLREEWSVAVFKRDTNSSKQLETAILKAVPQLSDEANKGYPSLYTGATQRQLERAALRLFGKESDKVVLMGVMATVRVPRDPQFQAKLTAAIALEHTSQKAVERLAKQLDSASEAGATDLQHQYDEARTELSIAQSDIRKYGYPSAQFKGEIFILRTANLVSARGLKLALLPDLQKGTLVQKGQVLSQPERMLQAEPVKPVNVRTTIVKNIKNAISLSMDFPSGVQEAIGNLLIEDPSKYVRKFVVVKDKRMQPNVSGVYTTDIGPVYASLYHPSPVNFNDFIAREGVGQFLQGFGLYSEVELPPKFTKGNVNEIPPPVAAAYTEKFAKKLSSTEIDWIKGKSDCYILALTENNPYANAQKYTADDIQLPFRIEGIGGVKPTLVNDIIKLTLYTIEQKKPVDVSPIFFKAEEVTKGTDLKGALACAINKYIAMSLRNAQLQKEAKSLLAKQKEAKKTGNTVFTDAEINAAAQRAMAFGTTKRDIEYLRTRVTNKKLQEAAEGHQKFLDEIEETRGSGSSAGIKYAETLIKAGHFPPGTSVDHVLKTYSATDAEVKEEMQKIKDKIKEPNIILDPMFDMLIVAQQSADQYGVPRPDFLVSIDWSTYVISKGLQGTALGKLIKAFQMADKIGYVPKKTPAGRAQMKAMKFFKEVREMSDQVALAAAGRGLSAEGRGKYGVSKISASPAGKGVILGQGLSIQKGGAGGASKPSFGVIDSSAPRSRRETMMSRLSDEDLKNLPDTYGPRQAKSLRALSHGDKDLETTTPVVRRETFKLNPRRFFNPEQPLNDAILNVPPIVKVAITSVCNHMSELASGEYPPHSGCKALKQVTAYAAAADWALSKLTKEQAMDAGLIAQVRDQVYDSKFLSSLLRATEAASTPAIKVGDLSFSVNETDLDNFKDLILAGFFYRRGKSGKLQDRNPREISLLLIAGPFASVWVEKFAILYNQAQLHALTGILPIDQLNSIEANVDTIFENEGDERLSRTISANPLSVAVPGLFLSESDKLLISSFASAAVSATTLPELAKSTSKAYENLFRAMQDKKRDPRVIQELIHTYETNLRNLQKQIVATGADTENEAKILVEAKLMHYLGGRLRLRDTPESVQERLSSLRSSIGSYLDTYGRPLTPINAATYESIGVRPPDYGEGASLKSRMSLQQAANLVRSSPQTGKSVATSTLMIQPTSGTGISDFARPYMRHKPKGWNDKDLFNVIWLSPDGTLARIYRSGAFIGMFRRPPGTRLAEFLSDVAENWSVWLTDPEHKRLIAKHSLDIYLGQSGDPDGYMYLVHSSSSKTPLARANFVQRAQVVGVGFDDKNPDKLSHLKTIPETQALIKAKKIVVWANEQTVMEEAQTFVDAMKNSGLLGAQSSVNILRSLIRGAPEIQNDVDAEKSIHSSTVVIFSSPDPTGKTYGSGATVPMTLEAGKPTGDSFTKTVLPYLMASSTPLRVYDVSFTGTLRVVALKLALGEFEADNEKLQQAKSLMLRTPAGLLLEAYSNFDRQIRPSITVVAGEPIKAVPDLERKLKLKFADLKFDASAQRAKENQVESLLIQVMSPGSPVLIVDTLDIAAPIESSHDDQRVTGISLLNRVYDYLIANNRATTPVVYAYAGIRFDKKEVNKIFSSLRMKFAEMAGVDESQIDLRPVSYSQLPIRGNVNLFDRSVKLNPRQRMHRQVASQWMRSYPFVG